MYFYQKFCMHKKLVVFDFDLTLADSANGVFECMNHALEKSGFQAHTYEEVKRTIGHTLVDSFQMLTGISDKLPADKFVKIYVEHADKVMNVNTRVYDEVFSILPFLKKQEIATAIVSTKYRYRIQEILERDKLSTYFDLVVGGEDVLKHKPDPEGLIKAILQLNKTNQETLYVGDSLVDWETAQKAGVDFCAVLTGTVSEEEFRARGASLIIKSLDELMNVAGLE